MAGTHVGVVFKRLAAPADFADAAGFDSTLQQLAPSAGDGVRVQAEKLRQLPLAAVSQLEGFDGGIEATLLFIQQAVEQQDGRWEFVGGNFQAGGIGNGGNGLHTASREPLALPGGGF